MFKFLRKKEDPIDPILKEIDRQTEELTEELKAMCKSRESLEHVILITEELTEELKAMCKSRESLEQETKPRLKLIKD